MTANGQIREKYAEWTLGGYVSWDPMAKAVITIDGDGYGHGDDAISHSPIQFHKW